MILILSIVQHKLVCTKTVQILCKNFVLCQLLLTGHSLGGGAAQLVYLKLKMADDINCVPTGVYSFYLLVCKCLTLV